MSLIVENKSFASNDAQLLNIEIKKSPMFSYFINYFLLYLPVIIIYSLIIVGYVGYIYTYISVLLNAENYDPDDFPFQLTSSISSAKKKGLTLLILSTFFIVLLLVSITKTVFMDPGYLDSPLAIENKIIQSQ